MTLYVNADNLRTWLTANQVDGTLATADTQPPTAPSALTASNVTSSGVTLTWGASTDNVGVTSYAVSRNGAVVANVAGTSVTDSGLAASTTYTYTVRAYDAAGNASPNSSSVGITTAASGGGATVPGKAVVFSAPFSDSSQWTVGRTSAFPGSSPQTNTGDYKSDRISPTISAPDADGTFRAVRNGSYWDADLVTTEYAAGNFQARVGDSLTATVRVNAQVGAWPAIWTWSTGTLQSLPGHGEVDLFEYHGENATTLEFTNHVTSGTSYPAGYISSGVPFELRVDFDAAGVKFYINGTLRYTAGGLPTNWQSNLIVNLSVASVDNPYHAEPPTGVNALDFQVTNLKVWR